MKESSPIGGEAGSGEGLARALEVPPGFDLERTAQERQASRAFELNQLVMNLVQARDPRELEVLGMVHLTTLLEADGVMYAYPGADGTWELSSPGQFRKRRARAARHSELQPLLARTTTVLELDLGRTVDPLLAHLRDLGYLRARAFPLEAGREVLGVVAVLSRSDERPEDELTKLALQVSMLLGVCLQYLKDDAARQDVAVKLQAVLKLAQVGGWELDLSTGHMEWSRELRSLLGVGEQELSDTVAGFVSDARSAQDFQRALQQLATTGLPATLSGVMRRADGTTLDTVTVAELMCDDEGRAARLRAVSRDISRELERERNLEGALSELKRTEARLRRSEQLLRQASALARFGAWERGLSEPLRVLSEEACHVFGLSPGSRLSHEGMLRLFEPASARQLDAAHRLLELQGTPYDLELELNPTPGGARWVRMLARVDQPAGRILGAVQDVTESREQREAALAASRVKSQILANTSHEIRTPLNGIIGMTQLALDTALTEEQREYLQTVASSAARLKGIVNDILDIAKIESGKLHLEAVPFDLVRTVHETMREHQAPADEKGLSLVLDVADTLPDQVVGDPLRLQQVVTNLVGNALKFTTQGHVLVQLAPAERELVALAVRDSGAGIAPERQAAIFEAFTQEDGSTSRRFGGTGLGLTICRELVQRMGGNLWVESQAGQGATFHATFRLPRHRRSAITPVEGLTSPEPRPLAGRHVLLAEPDPVAAAVYRRLLERAGARVAWPEAGGWMRALLAALEGAPEDRFTALVVNDRLPGTSGLELCQAVAGHASLARATRVLLVHTQRPGEEALQQAGISRALPLPVLGGALVNALADAPGPAARASAPEAPGPGRSLSILLAEDNAVNARLAIRLLERQGHRVRHVTDGRQAVRAACDERYDVVLMDVQMPELDGLDATRRIRSWEATHGGHVPIIALTANAMKGDDTECFSAGMDDYIAKPIEPHRLGEQLRRWAGGARPHVQAPSPLPPPVP